MKVLGGPHVARGPDVAQAWTKVSLSVLSSGLVFSMWPGLFIGTKKWPGPGCRYRYNDDEVCKDNFFTNSESDRGSRYLYCTNKETQFTHNNK